jgi:hypothetical protein
MTPESSSRNIVEPVPDIDERFVVKAPFRSTKAGGKTKFVRMLNADGHIDVAHKMGLIGLETTVLERWVESSEQTNDDGEKFVSQTRWCMVKARASVKSPTGETIVADGTAVAHDRDKFVKQPGYEIMVAETRAIKRALSNACNITDKYINPEEGEPTRETVDMPLPPDDFDEKPGLPSDMLRKPDISPMVSSIKQRDPSASKEQFDL